MEELAMLNKLVEVAVEDLWDAQRMMDDKQTPENEERLNEAYTDLCTICSIRDTYIMATKI